MKTELGILIDSGTQALTTWMQQNDLTGVTSAVTIAAFSIAGLFMLGHMVAWTRSPK